MTNRSFDVSRGGSRTACIICGYIHVEVPRGVSSLGSGDQIISHKLLTPQAIAQKVTVPPSAGMSRPPFRCAWDRAAPIHQSGILTSANALREVLRGRDSYCLITQRYVGLLALDNPTHVNARVVWVGLVDDGDAPIRLLVGPGRILHSGFLGRNWTARSLVAIPTEIAPGSRDGVERATKTAVLEAIGRLSL